MWLRIGCYVWNVISVTIWHTFLTGRFTAYDTKRQLLNKYDILIYARSCLRRVYSVSCVTSVYEVNLHLATLFIYV
jgi:hypothetical protein